MAELPTSFFQQIAKGMYEPTEAVIGPWSYDLQHGGPPCALLTHAIRTLPSSGDLQLCRITFEFLSGVPVDPCEIIIDTLRPGKKVELLKAQYLAAGKPVLLAHAWKMRAENGLTRPVTGKFIIPGLPGPQEQRRFPGIDYFPYLEAMEWRFVKGGFACQGPASVWVRPRIPLVENQQTDGLEAMVLMVDSANGISAELDIREWTYMPIELTISLFRLPLGFWTGMKARTIIGSEGIGQTTAAIFDSRGCIGHSIQTLFVEPK